MVVVAYERDHSRENPTVVLQLGKFWCFFLGGGSLMGCGHQREELVPHGGLTQVLFTITDEVTYQIL